MATLYVSWVGGVQDNVAKGPIKAETVTTSGVTAKSAVNPGAGIAIVFSDAAHYVNIGPVGTVTAVAGTSMYVPANAEREFSVDSGEAVAAITV